MCGIIGVVDKRGVDRDLLLKMRDTITHRGPDDAGIWLNPDKTVGLAQRRLSIIDLSAAGHQPMLANEEKLCITYNGEVYNFLEIRSELEQADHRFTSRTDTEVILKAYAEWGFDCLAKFNGMFSFCIYDQKQNILFLARDRAGKKPLYFTQYEQKFVFASELKAIMSDQKFRREIDLDALNYYLTYGYIGGARCIFKSVNKLPPAHAMVYNLGNTQIKTWQYWEPPYEEDHSLSEPELLAELERLFEDAVRLRLISDVPLGAFLSGGVDSSLVVAMMSRVSDQPVKTFSIGFGESKYNELPYARIVAQHFATEHHEIIVKPDAFAVLPKLVQQFDEPFADSSLIPTYYVSKATRESVTVALSGDGGDELFGGYSQYFATQLNHYAAKFLPSSLRKAIAYSAEYLPAKMIDRKQLTRLKYDPDGAFIDRSSHLYFKERYRRHIYNKDVETELADRFFKPEISRRGYLDSRKGDFINHLTYTDFMTYLPDDILVKVDRASMLVSLEVRAPLLDYRIAEFAFRHVPGSLKVKGRTSKYLLKRLAQKILPPQLDINRKWGFSIPVSEWFKGPLFSELKEILLSGNNSYFSQSYIEKLLNEHKANIDHSGRLFTLLTFSLWHKEYMEN